MQDAQISYISNKAMPLYPLMLLLVSLSFLDHVLPAYWIAFGFVEFFGFFLCFKFCCNNWLSVSEKSFERKVFFTALTIRLFYVVFIYFFYIFMTLQPFEFDAADSMFYDSIGRDISNAGLSHAWNILTTDNIDFSDRGNPYIISTLYSVFGQYVIVPRLFNAFTSSITCILIYKLSLRNFGEKPARYSAIIMVFLSNFIYYCGLHLKETSMIFLVVFFLERSDYAIRTEGLKPQTLILPALLAGSLFLFRTVLGATACASFFCALLFTSGKVVGLGKRIGIGLVMSFFVIYFFPQGAKEEVNNVWQARGENQQQSMKFRTERKGGNKYAKYGSAAIFAPMIFTVPYPSLVDTGQDNQEQRNGEYMVKQVLSFFVLLALFLLLFKYKSFRQHILLLAFFFSYVLVIAFSGFAVSERFHFPALPVFVILAGFGMTQLTEKYKKYYVPYLVFMGLVIIAWNVFKLSGRGMTE